MSASRRSQRGPGRALGVAAMLVPFLAAASLPASANHVQTDGGKVVAFDHVKGNEWWVEVALSGQDAASVAKVEAQDTNGAWVALAKKSWGPYAASFHIEPGHDVRFRATWAGGAQTVSCWFTHPGGTERCAPPPGSFDATFGGVRGNEWWVQAQVASASGPAVAKVEVSLNAGAWKPVAKQSWGWGSSYHIPQGTIVQLRATATDGQVDPSQCYKWIPPSGQDASVVECGGSPPPPPPQAFDATFSGVKGNDWWVQVNVAANEPLAGVGVRINCFVDWTPLAKQSWGGWTASFHIPPGSKVDFMARSTDQDADVSGGYIWPNASPAAGCPQGAWPREGSFVTYDLESRVCGGGECEASEADLRLRYTNGQWRGTCEGTDSHTDTFGVTTTRAWTTSNDGLPPAYQRPHTQVGAQHPQQEFIVRFGQGCGMIQIGAVLTVVRQEDHETQMMDASGNPVTLRTWFAERDESDESYYTAHWDTKVGLVLETHSFPRRSGSGSSTMAMSGTDAPLR